MAKHAYHNSDYLLTELVEQTLLYLRSAVIGGLFIAVLLCTVLWQSTDHSLLLKWLAAMLLVSTCRLLIYFYYLRSAHKISHPQQWVYALSSTAIVSGITWGLAGVLFFSINLPQNNIFIAFTLGGIVAAATSTLAPLQKTMRVFAIALFCPIIIEMLFTGDFMFQVMAIMLVFYVFVCIIISLQIHTMLITSLSLRRENISEIEERKKAEEALRKRKENLERIVEERTLELRINEERYRDLVEKSSDWIWEIDTQGNYTYASPRVEALLGYKVEEVIRKTLFDLTSDEEANRIRKAFIEIISEAKPISTLECTVWHNAGHKVVLECSAEPIKNNAGEILGYRGIARDITERKKINEQLHQQQNLESIGLLAGGIAHDFNNLLQILFGNIALAKATLHQHHPARILLEQTNLAMEHAKKLTGQLLTFAKGGDPIKTIIDITELIAETCRFVLSGSNIQYNMVMTETVWPVEVDKSQIWQVLQNLLHNAAEAMPEGGHLTVTAANTTIDTDEHLPLITGNYIKVSITDQGPGIEPALLTKIFEPYFSTKNKGAKKGMGLGLSTSHSIIKKHSGHLTIESEMGHGTTVSFYLPASPQAQIPLATAEQMRSKKIRTGLRLLILEDDDAVLKVTTQMLKELKIECDAATDGVTIEDLYQQAQLAGQAYDGLILDLTVRGGIGGKEVIEQLYLINPNVKAIIASGYADNEVLANYKLYGFKAAITKPYTIAKLEQAIKDSF